MSLEEEIGALRRRLDELARTTDDELTRRYALSWPRVPPGIYWRTRWLAGMALRLLESIGILRPAPWPASLKQSPAGVHARPLLIWAVGTDREKLREACRGFSGVLEALPEFAPVLVTDVADFAFFSRLGWLVEYLPRLTGEGQPYEDRKERLLASLYRGAPALPVSAGLGMIGATEGIRQCIIRSADSRGRAS